MSEHRTEKGYPASAHVQHGEISIKQEEDEHYRAIADRGNENIFPIQFQNEDTEPIADWRTSRINLDARRDNEVRDKSRCIYSYILLITPNIGDINEMICVLHLL
jgi:hypothetical protein